MRWPVKQGSRRWWAMRTERKGECILWTGAVNNHGYGVVRVNGRYILAHRFAYGKVPSGKLLHHRCGHTRCVRRAHLEPVTYQEHRDLHGTYERTPQHKALMSKVQRARRQRERAA